MTQTRGSNNKGGNGKNNSNGGKPSYFDEAKALYERFRAEIGEAADKKDGKYLDFKLDEIVGKLVEETDRRGKPIVRFSQGAMADDQLEMLINASGMSFGQVLNSAITTFPNVFGKNMDEPEKRCHVRTLTRAMALTVAYLIADEESARVTAEYEARRSAAVADFNAATSAKPPVAVEPADEAGAKDGTTGA